MFPPALKEKWALACLQTWHMHLAMRNEAAYAPSYSQYALSALMPLAQEANSAALPGGRLRGEGAYQK